MKPKAKARIEELTEQYKTKLKNKEVSEIARTSNALYYYLLALKDSGVISTKECDFYLDNARKF